MHETALPLTSSSPTPARDRDERSSRRNWRDQLPVLEGRRVSLRELDASDAATLLPLLGAPEVARFLSPPPQSLERFAGFIEATLIERRGGRYAGFAIVPHETGRPVGLVQIRQLDPSFGTAEWGVALAAEWWGRGLFVDAGQLLLDFAFSELGTFRVEARVAARNARGNRAVEKLGAVAEGLLRGSLVVADGSRHDQVLWSWLKEDWRRARAAETEASTWVH
jgi:ribosomal-protein-alanine N-acetyltransferase